MADQPIDADLVGDEPEQSTNSLSEKIAKMYPIGRKPNPNRSQLLRAVWMSTIILTIPFVAAIPLLNPEPEREVEEWYADWAVQSWSQQVDGSPAQGARVEAMVTVDHGGLLEANYTVEYLGTGGIGALVGCQQDWTVELRSPDPVNFSDGSNATSWSGENWEGSDRVIIDTP